MGTRCGQAVPSFRDRHCNFCSWSSRGSSLGVNLGRRVSTRTVEMKLEQKELDVETLAMTSLPGFVLRKEWQNRVAE